MVITEAICQEFNEQSRQIKAEKPENSSQAVQHLKAEIAKKLQWYKQQQCDGGLEVDIPSVINDLKQLAAIE